MERDYVFRTFSAADVSSNNLRNNQSNNVEKLAQGETNASHNPSDASYSLWPPNSGEAGSQDKPNVRDLVHEGQRRLYSAVVRGTKDAFPFWKKASDMENIEVMCIPEDVRFSLKPSPFPYFVNEEVEYFLQLNPPPQWKVCPAELASISAHVLHSSGFIARIKLQIKEGADKIRCSFIPPLAGVYSARIYWKPLEIRSTGQEEGSGAVLLCPPMEFEVHWNYEMKAIFPVIPSIRLPPNGDNYWGLTADKTGDRLFVSDRANSDIITIDQISGIQITRFGTCYLHRPSGMAVDVVNKRLLICDTDHHRIIVTSLDGVFILAFGRYGYEDGQFINPWDISISPDAKTIAVSDSGNHRIQFFDHLGNFTKKFSSSVFKSSPFESKLYLANPRGLVFGNDGQFLFITDFNTNNVVELNIANLTFRHLVPARSLHRPQGITIDDIGCLLVCDSLNHCVHSLKGTQRKTTVSKVGGQQLIYPTDIDILRGGQVAVLGINGVVNFF